MNDPLYSVTGRLETARFKPSPLLNMESLSEASLDYYKQLLEDFGFKEDLNEYYEKFEED